MTPDPGTIEARTDKHGYTLYRVYCPECGRMTERRSQSGAQRVVDRGCGVGDCGGGGGE